MFGFLGFLLIIFLLIVFIGFTFCVYCSGSANVPPIKIELPPTRNKIHILRIKRMTRMRILQNPLLQIDVLIRRETEKKSLMRMRESM